MKTSMSMIGNRVTWMTGMAVAGVSAVVALAGCGLSEAVTEHGNGHVKTVGYANGAQGKDNQEARLPDWVPDQATSVTEVIRTTGSERLLRFTSTDAGLPDTCVPGEAAKTAATLSADWWPGGQESKTDQVCDEDWHVYIDADVIYAFRPETIDQAGAN
jgi:hypothetical protein